MLLTFPPYFLIGRERVSLPVDHLFERQGAISRDRQWGDAYCLGLAVSLKGQRKDNSVLIATADRKSGATRKSYSDFTHASATADRSIGSR